MKNSLLCSTFLSISEFKLDEKFLWNGSLYTKNPGSTKTRAFIRGKNKVDQKIWKQQLCDVFMCKYKICHILKHSLELFFKPTHIWLPLEFYYYIISRHYITLVIDQNSAFCIPNHGWTPLLNWLEIGKKVQYKTIQCSSMCTF